MYDELTTLAKQLLLQKFQFRDAVVEWKRPTIQSHGDLTTPVALQLANTLHVPPQEIAQVLVEGLGAHSSVERIEVAHPGYVNLWLHPVALIEELKRTRDACTRKVSREKERPVIVEYSDPNVAKPLGVHHLLPPVIGHAIANLYEHMGYPVVRWNYLGDWGTQFGQLAVAVEKWGSGKVVAENTLDDLLTLYVRFHQEAEHDPILLQEAREAFRKLEGGDPSLRIFWSDVVAVTKRTLEPIYQRLHVHFDVDIGESFYNDKMATVVEEGCRKGVFSVGEGGALIVEFPIDSGLPVYMILKSDGATLYSTRDLAQMRYRIDAYNPQVILIVTDVAQKLHFEQLEETCLLLHWSLPSFENVLFGRMRFADRSMSTRKGNILKLQDVLDEAVHRAEGVIEEHRSSIHTEDRAALAEMMGIGALVYGILSQNRKMDIVFDWDRMLSFEGNSAPYVQYTHARACSVLRKADVPEADCPTDVAGLTENDRGILTTLLQFPEVLQEAWSSHMPHLLAQYLYRLCQEYNSFYTIEPILKAEEPNRSLRLGLTSHTALVLKTGAQLLTLEVPEHM